MFGGLEGWERLDGLSGFGRFGLQYSQTHSHFWIKHIILVGNILLVTSVWQLCLGNLNLVISCFCYDGSRLDDNVRYLWR